MFIAVMLISLMLYLPNSSTSTSLEPTQIPVLKKPSLMQTSISNASLSETGRMLVLTKSSIRYSWDYLPPFKLGQKYLHFVNGTGRPVMDTFLFDDPNTQFIPDQTIFSMTARKPDPSPKINGFIAKDIMGMQKVWDEYNITGNGVTLGVTDSGVDFGVGDLVDSPKLLSSGITASFDATGYGISPTTLTLQAEIISGTTVLPLEGQNLTINMGEEGGIGLSSSIGISLENLDISLIANRSKSGNYKVGMMYEPGEIRQVFLYVLVDSNTAGIYDELWVDMSTSLGLSLAMNGIIFEVGRLYRQLVDWSLSDEIPYGSFNPIIARDIDGDGVNDVSMGALASVLDLQALVNGGIVRGIDPQGRGIGVIYDAVGHGTQVSSAAVGRGKVPIQIYDNFTSADEIENKTVYYLPGSAPNANLIVTKGLQITDFLLGWFWSAGLEPVLTGNGGWIVNEEHRVDISSNSWGDGSIGTVLKGVDTLSFLVDALSTPNIFSKIDFGVTYPDYPGIIFFIASGNGGPGFGTVTVPGASASAITVGASTSFHPQKNPGRNDVALFSGSGPTPTGLVKPDLVALGSFGFTMKVLITGAGNGTKAAGEFGGTSEATPRAAGVGALIIEALRKQGITPTLNELKTRLKSTAKDLSFPTLIQGSGLVNAYDAVSSVFNTDYVLLKDTESSTLIGNELNKEFSSLFGTDHPFLSGTFFDSSIYGFSSNYSAGRKVSLVFSNGSAAPLNRMNIVQFVQTEERTTQFTTSLSSNGIYKLDKLSSLVDGDFLLISIGLTEASYEKLSETGLTMPNMQLIDFSSGRIVDESFSTAYSQILYSGNPADDFPSTPAIKIEDPGFLAGVPFWEGLTFEIHAFQFDRVIKNFELSKTNNDLVNIKSENLSDTFQIFSVELKQPNGTTYLPLVVLDVNEVKYGSAVDPIGDELRVKTYYSENFSYGAFNWYGNTARPEAGDYRFYKLKVPNNATYLAIRLNWTRKGMLPNLYLYDSNGILVTNSATEYVGGGFYRSSTSEPNAQNLFIPVNDTEYTLLAHFIRTPYGAGPYQFDLTVRYLKLKAIPKPVETFSQDLTKNISGTLNINSNNYSVAEFPELKLTKTSVQIFKGNNGTINGSIPSSLVSNKSFTPEYFFPIEFEAGDKGKIELIWYNQSYDLDIYLFPADNTKQNADLLMRQGTKPGPFNESALFAINRTLTYFVMVDFVAGDPPANSVNFIIKYETRNGPIFSNDGAEIDIDTTIFANGHYGLKVFYQTNFPITFENFYETTLLNHFNFSSSLISPDNSAVLSGFANISWTSDVPTTALFYLENDTLSIFLGSSSTQSFAFDTTLYENGNYRLKIIITDGVFSHIYYRDINIQNEQFSSLPPLTTLASTSPIPVNSFSMIIGLAIIVVFRFFVKFQGKKINKY